MKQKFDCDAHELVIRNRMDLEELNKEVAEAEREYQETENGI